MAKAASAQTASYRVLSPILGDGGKYMPGEKIDLTPDQVDELVASGAIEREPLVAPAAAAAAAAPAATAAKG